MTQRLQLGTIEVDVVFKNIKNVHLSVNPPNGRVRISAPARMKLDTVRVFAISKLEWIKRQRRRFEGQHRETAREYIIGESHFLWGKRYLLRVITTNAPSQVTLQHRYIVLQVREGATLEKRKAVLDAWYRGKLKEAATARIAHWQDILRVQPNRLFVQSMKTRWGSCNTVTGNIRLNAELAKKPAECLEYLVVHELLHLIERRHNDHFHGLLDRHMPGWRSIRHTLNGSPLAHAEWEY